MRVDERKVLLGDGDTVWDSEDVDVGSDGDSGERSCSMDCVGFVREDAGALSLDMSVVLGAGVDISGCMISSTIFCET